MQRPAHEATCTSVKPDTGLLLYLKPEVKPNLNVMIMTWLPYFVFIMYAINRGTNFTQALFMNCDHSLPNIFFLATTFCVEIVSIRLRES